MSPNAEVGMELPELDANQLLGREFLMPGTKTDDEDSYKSLLYYREHQPLRENRKQDNFTQCRSVLSQMERGDAGCE